MAKYRIQPTLITALTDAGFIDGGGDTVQIFAYRGEGGPTTYYKLTFAAATAIIETTNDRMIKSLNELAPPGVKVNGTWLVADPATTKLFEVVADGDPNPTIDPQVDGVEQISVKEKNLVVRYANASGDKPEPAGRDKTTLGPWVTKARNYFNNLRS